MKRTISILALALAVGVVGGPTAASAQDMYEVKITNLTPGQAFTPFLLVTHSPDMNLFIPGTMASDELRAIAEGGNIMPMKEMYMGMMGVMDVQSIDMMTTPGVTNSIMVSGMYGYRVSLVAMLLPTNDGFVGANMMLPMEGGMMGYAYGYDAGTEMNDEMCSSIPNPGWNDMECDAHGHGEAIGMGEGAIVIHSGIHGHGDFMPMYRDWKNPVARITINKM
ncbi:MAG: hypothetical protein F4Y14_10610 [Acidobacteria bacterium]|nr:hypothetical protein [Acidobacteriota bacterium]